MSDTNENQAAPEVAAQPGGAKEAPETETASGEEKPCSSCGKIHGNNVPDSFDKEDLVNTTGGKIDVILQQLYDACIEESLPMVAFVNYKVTNIPEEESYVSAIRGMQVSCNGFLPPALESMIKISGTPELAKVVHRITHDPMVAMMMKVASLENELSEQADDKSSE